MNILITGCMGFIGSYLSGMLLSKGVKVIGIDNLSNASLIPSDRIKMMAGEGWKNFSFWNIDIRDAQALKSVFINGNPDFVIHLAALGSVPRSWDMPEKVLDVNEVGFVNVLKQATQIGVKRFLFASSSSVYGPSEKNVKWEKMPLNPASPYALTKVQNEKFCELWSKSTGIDWIGMRFFNVYGPGQSHESNYSAVIPRFLTKDKIKIFGDGKNIRDFTFVEDVCNSIIKLMHSKYCNLVINIGSGFGTTINSLKDICTEGRNVEVEYVAKRPGDPAISIASNDLLMESIGDFRFTNLKDGIAKTKSFYSWYTSIYE